ncbi:MAG: hypothetical protein JXA99_14470, partial [Candidatus Lokiarchaeota archaeon]|nr:hypothetical protein [Candidatus Lokiarchaeota archaeon]
MVKIEKKNKTKILILMLILNTFCIFNFFFIEKTYGIDRSISVNKSIANIGEQVQIKIGISDKTAFYEHAKLYKVINGNSVFMGDYYEQAELVKINDILTEIGEIYYYVDYWYYVSSPTGGGDFNEYQRLSTATIQVSNDLTILNCDEYAIVGENIDLYWYIEDSPNVYSEYSELYCSINNQPFEKIATFYQIGCAHFQYMVDFAGVDYKFKVVNYGSNGDSSSSSVRIPYWQSGTKSFIAKQLIQFQDDLIPMSGHLTWDLFSLDWVLKDSVFNQFRHILEQGSFDKALEGAAAYLCSGLGTIIGIHMGILTSTIDSFLTTLTIETLWGVSTYISIEYIITRDDVSSIDLWNVAYSAAGGIKDKIIDKINHKMLEILHPLTLLTENQWSNFIDIYLDVYGWALFITARGYIQTQLGENSFNYINYGVDYILIFNPLITKLNHLANNYYIFSQNLKKQLTNEEITIEIDKILVNLTDIQTYLRTCRGLSKVVSDPIAIAIRNFIDKMVARLTALKPIKLTPISPSVLIDDSIILDIPFDEGEGYEVKDTNNNYVGTIGNSLDYGNSMVLDSDNWDNGLLKFENRGTYNGDFIYFDNISATPLGDPTGYDFTLQIDFYSESTNYHEYLLATGGQTSAIGICAVIDNIDKLVVNVHTQNAKFETPRSYIVPQNEWMTLTIRFHGKDSNIEDQYLEVYLNNTRIYYVDHGTSISGWNYGASNELCIGAPNGKPNYNYPVAHYFT